MRFPQTLSAAALGLALTLPAVHAQPVGIPDDREQAYLGGVAAVAHPLAAEIGAEILRKGGNAIDAAVAIQFALNVVEPTSSGIGGGGFMMIHIADTGETVVIDSREKAPAAATPDMFLNEAGEPIGSFTERATSGIAVGVPGTLLGVATALERYGSGNFTLADLIAPAIPLAEGFNINERLASLTDSSRTSFWPETRDKFRNPDGSPLEPGYFLEQPDLANTFRMIAESGPEVFYTGEIASAIVAAQQRFREEVGPAGAGRMTLADLAAYFDAGVDIRMPVMGEYRGYTYMGMPYPSSGGLTVLQVLKLLEQFPLGDEEAGFGFGAPRTLHVMAEALRLAFADRAVWMGDSDFVDLPDDGLVDDAYIAMRAAMIDPDARMETDPEAGDPRPFDDDYSGQMASLGKPLYTDTEGTDTTHFSVLDVDGNAVSYTSTIEGTWGSGITVPGYGFLLNNELTDFNSAPTANDDPTDFNPGANDVAPFKRPRSSMAPSMLFQDGQFLAAYGSPGGSTIISSSLNMTLNLVDHDMDVQQAIDAPRIAVTSSSGTIFREQRFGYDTINTLIEDYGHSTAGPFDLGSVQATVLNPVTGVQYGGADDRRAGTVEGVFPLGEPFYNFDTGFLYIPRLKAIYQGDDLGDWEVLMQRQGDAIDDFDFSVSGAGLRED